MSIRLRYPEVAPGGYAALTSFGHYITTETALEPVLKGFIDLRASQLNGCDFCVQMHSAELLKHHEPQSRIDALASWQTSDAFTTRERAALAWTELLTTLDHHVTDEEFDAISEFFTGKDLADLTYAIANINAWNRLGIAFRPTWNPQKATAESNPAQQDTLTDDGAKVAEN